MSERSPTDAITEAIFVRVKRIVGTHLGVAEDRISLGAAFTADLGADSLNLVEMTIAFENEFAISIPDEDAEGIKTVQQVVDYIQQHVENAANPR